MLGKTHAVIGVTAGLLVMQPKNMTELVVGTSGALIGAVISDIDVGTSGSHRDANKMIALMVSAVVAVGVADHIWQIGIYRRMIQHVSLVRIWLDFFNKKGERIFFPAKKFFGIRMLSSSGLFNDVMFGTGFVAAVRVIWMFVKRICL